MHKHEIELLVALDEEGGFGKDGQIPWYHSEDLKHFQKMTTDNVCIMGRKTYEDMLEMRKVRDEKNGKTEEIKEILPNRESYVVTRSDTMETPGATKVKSLREAMSKVPTSDKRTIFVIGGERMYIEGLSWASKVHVTVVPGVFDCDKFFPVTVLMRKFQITEGRRGKEVSFITYSRIR